MEDNGFMSLALDDVHCDKEGLYSCTSSGGRFTYKTFLDIYYDKFEKTIQTYLTDPEQLVFMFKTTVNGKVRQIITYRETTEGQMLRHLHRLFALVFQRNYEPHPESYAYQKGKNIELCLKKHLRSDTFLKTDIHSYFDSVSYDLLIARILQLRIWPKSRKDSLKKIVSTCFYNGHLPIGFVSSPILSDIFLKDLDERMSVMKGIRYTRYADDIIVSSSGNDAKNKLEQILETLKTEITNHKLELNDQKTYIRHLKLEGDAIHLLGLNMVKTQTKRNRITVSQSFITETSKEIGYLLQNKTNLESWELQQKFTSAMGKVSFIRHVSKDSAKKLKKLLEIKTGYKGYLTYKALSKVLFENVSVLHEFEKEKQIETYIRIKKIKSYPTSGRCWERVTIPADMYKDVRKKLQSILYGICREFESDTNSVSINRLEVSIGEEQYRFEYPWDVKQFRSFIKRICTESAAINYSADYLFGIGRPETLEKSDENHSIRKGFFCPVGGFIPFGTRIVYSEKGDRWLFTQESYSQIPGRGNSGGTVKMETAEITEVMEQSEWEGRINVNLRWPFQMDDEIRKEINTTASRLKNLLKPWMQEDSAPGDSRCFQGEKIRIRTEAQTLASILDSLKDLSSLVKQTNGVNEIDAWFIPVGFLETTKETRLKYLNVSTPRGKFKMRKFEE